MKMIFKTMLLLIMAVILNSCAGLSGAVKPQEHDRLNSVVPESFHFNIRNKTIRNYLAGTEPDQFPPDCQLDRKLEIILLASLAEAKDEGDLARVFDNLWQNNEKFRELINYPEKRTGFIRPTVEIYYLLSAIPGAEWQNETANRIYQETLKDISPEQISGYALHFYTLALLKKGKYNTALPFLLRLELFVKPADYLKDLSIALSFAIEDKDYSSAVKIMEQVCRAGMQNNLKFPDQQMYDAVKAMKTSGNISLAQSVLSPLIKENPGLETFMFAKLLRKKPVLAQEPGAGEKAAISGEAQAWQVLATSPGVKVLSQVTHNPGRILEKGKNPLETAQDWLAENNLEEGRNLKNKKLLYISIGAATVNARPEDPGFIDSRFLAFQRAELEAKAKTAIFLGADLTTSKGASEREINPEERAALKDILNASPRLKRTTKAMNVDGSIFELFEKSNISIRTKPDKAIREAAVESKTKKINRLRNISETSMKAAACAFAEVQGSQVIQAFEGSYHKNYQVVIITLWSQNLQKMVDSMVSGRALFGLERKKAKTEITGQLPENPKKLACMSGVRAYINQHGEHVLLAFGQAGVEVIGGREDKAYEKAGKKARLRALASMRTFMGEKVAFTASEELAEALALYADEYKGGEGSQEYKSISQFQEKIRAVSNRQKLTGVHGLLTKELIHPFTDKPMVLKIMAWSPSSQKMAQDIKQAIEYKPEHSYGQKRKEAIAVEEKEIIKRKGIISSGDGADEDAW
jgi:hypothetical protein